MKRVCLALLTILIAVSVNASGRNLRITLKLDPPQALPAIPANIHIAIQNLGDEVITLPDRLLVLVHPIDGEPFVAQWFGGSSVVKVDWEEEQLSAGAKTEFVFSIDGSLMLPGLFRDTRLIEPGTYHLTAYFPPSLVEKEFLENSGLRDRYLSSVLRSEPARFVVARPSGVDATILETLQAITEGGYWNAGLFFTEEGQRVARRVVTEYEDSTYAGWIAATGVGRTAEERAETLRNWLRNAHLSAENDWRMLRVAQWEEAVAAEYGQVRPVQARIHAERAHSILSALTGSKNPRVRRLALERVEKLAPTQP